jgi:hypothetical protein
MVTRSQIGTLSLVQRYDFFATHSIVLPVPMNYRSALADPHWHAAMADEYKVLVDNGTWRLISRPLGNNIVISKWIFKHKFQSDGLMGT